MVNDNVTPAWEVVLSVEGRVVGTCAAFQEGGEKFVVLVGVENATMVTAYADIVREAAFRINVAGNFLTVDEIRATELAGNEADPPF